MKGVLLLCLFLVFASALDYCPSELFPCSAIPNGYNCGDHYQFDPNTSTSVYPAAPLKCRAKTGGGCEASTTSCTPPCRLTDFAPHWKVGGPSGKICSGFLTQYDCNKYYAYNGSDKWCFWNSAVSMCFEGITCHN